MESGDSEEDSSDASRKYTDLQIDSEQARVQFAFIFLGQSQEDIRKKLQKLEGEKSKSLDKLLEVAWKVYNNRDKEVAKKQGQSLLAVIQGQGRGGRTGQGGNRGGFGRSRGGLRINKLEGHWKRECPNQFSQTSEPQIDNAAGIMVVYGGELGSKEPMVTLRLEGKDVTFL
ncbi:hypothetical protein HGM15179_020358 [Zosterops borbonicus]|uniref:Core shell protein Gag P30 domain-containing protein n=1 Tax=Zosterops borbonicus TaxID=364589 RepID=A0A8K1D849_9PASS|nr:hypothetical protein HGM15179_020358 [Zosterops borbonicus]